MKRVLLAAALVLSMVFITACGSSSEDSKKSSDGDTLKTGFAVTSSVENSKDAGKEDGLAQTDSTAFGVLVDSDGVIVKCVIDSAQTKINFSKEGKLLTPLDKPVPTKYELGDDYGLHKASSLGKDWKDQITAFCDYVQGKTLDEVKGISVDEKTAPKDEELASSVTIKIGGFIEGLDKAVSDAKDRGAKKGDTLGLGIVTRIDKSKDAGAEDGLAQANSSYALASFNGDGQVTSCVIDGSQSNLNFNSQGKFTSDLTAPQKTKAGMGDDYGMKAKSGIGKEWYEQSAAYSDYVLGKTEKEITDVAVNKEGSPADPELASSVTISVGDFNGCITKAFNMAR
ncbi:hypothetical protein NE619_06340 [Anaerovorax odorimutans]|uniref:Uncharacterized protein n=1 Tax=Anaerovorax odorimutans TaxID=109327 RepID=A0ABT1RN42_9FIRM|nr:hypothetical protein [Anaerovorax odorimutans]MCQ4636341.1 hypothetical protein [Anaerovorax odorimutans]